jgi:uncharacterized protein (DUF1810 family)
MTESNLHSLDRFLRAQKPVYDQVLAELAAGRKRTELTPIWWTPA